MADKVTGDRGVLETEVQDAGKGTDPQETVAQDDFDGSFEEATKTEAAEVKAEPEMEAEEPVAEGREAQPGTAENQPEAKSPEGKPEAKAPEVPEEKYEQRYRTLQGIHNKDKETWTARERELLAQLEEAKKPKATETPSVKQEEKGTAKKASDEAFRDSLTDEERKELEAYEADFDVVSKMEGLKRRQELAKLRKEFDDWKTEIKATQEDAFKQLRTQMNPALTLVEDTTREAHFGSISDAHPDYQDYIEGTEGYHDLLGWVENKPTYLRPALLRTLKEGTAGEVAELLTDFKKENNIPIEPQPSQEGSKVVNYDPKKAARKASLTAVTTRRGAVNPVLMATDDFEGAFEEAVHK